MNSYSTQSFQNFSLATFTFAGDIPGIIFFGSFLIIPGCLLGEFLYIKYAKSKKIIIGTILFSFLGVLYGTIIVIINGFSSIDISLLFFIYPNTTLGSILFFLFRRPWFKQDKKVVYS